jgi:hypothetical protein
MYMKESLLVLAGSWQLAVLGSPPPSVLRAPCSVSQSARGASPLPAPHEELTRNQQPRTWGPLGVGGRWPAGPLFFAKAP